MTEMNKSTCHYVFLARTALRNTVSGIFEFKITEEKFENEDPILAREAVFAYRNDFIRGMLTEGIGMSEDHIGWNPFAKKFEKLSEREIRRQINPFLEPEEEVDKAKEEQKDIDWKAPDDTLSWYPNFNNGIWIVMKHADKELHEKFGGDNDLVIDKVSRYEEPLPTPPNYLNLKEELEFYKKYKYDTKSYETSCIFFDDEDYLEGYYQNDGESEEQAKERHLEESKKIIEFLRTPFDWTGYEKINWWDKKLKKDAFNKVEAEQQKTLSITMEEALKEQENHYCEFKPGLINRSNSDRDMEYEIAQAICAFLNTKGGYLFIGVGDNGEILGLDFSRISKDKFRREFTRVKTRYLPIASARLWRVLEQ